MKTFEAQWRLKPGPITSEKQARGLFACIGAVTPIEPVRYDLNQRGQWRPFEPDHLIVDTLTQRTQVVTLGEERPVEEGGGFIIVATGKHGEPPQALARWQEAFPLSSTRREAMEEGLRRGFEAFSLASFLLRLAPLDDTPDGETQSPLLVASADADERAKLEGAGGPAHESTARGAGIWSFFPDQGSTPPPSWHRFWSQS